MRCLAVHFLSIWLIEPITISFHVDYTVDLRFKGTFYLYCGKAFSDIGLL